MDGGLVVAGNNVGAALVTPMSNHEAQPLRAMDLGSDLLTQDSPKLAAFVTAVAAGVPRGWGASGSAAEVPRLSCSMCLSHGPEETTWELAGSPPVVRGSCINPDACTVKVLRAQQAEPLATTPRNEANKLKGEGTCTGGPTHGPATAT